MGLGAAQAAYRGLSLPAIWVWRWRLLIVLCAAPALIALLAIPILKERPTALVWSAIGVAGTGLLASGPSNGVGAHGGAALGYVAAGSAALVYAGFALLSRRISGRLPPLQAVTLTFGTGAVVAALLHFGAEGASIVSLSAESWRWLLCLGVGPTAGAYALFLIGMRRIKATTAGVLTLIEALTAAVVAVAIFGETLDAGGVAGGALVLVGVVLVNWPRRSKE